MKLKEIKIYRLTHIGNILHILKYGITHKNSPNNNPDYIEIGDRSLIDTRSCKEVVADNGDTSKLNTPAIILGDFIPFYFGVKMPMLYVIQHGGNFVEKPVSPENIVYLACSLQLIIQSKIIFYFTDGHATDNLTTIYDSSKINDLPEIIDWEAVRASYWGGNENLDIKRKKQAEFLIKADLPSDFIIGFGCYSEKTKKELISLGVEERKIKIIPDAYY